MLEKEENLKDNCLMCLEQGHEKRATSSDGKLCDTHAYYRAIEFADIEEDLKFLPPPLRR
jgi:hypothetical protein